MNKFSVIIPSFNRANFLKQTLESVWTQTYRDYEVIVVDDGSTDNTKEYLHGIKSKVRVEYQINAGPGIARNTGARVSRGEYLAFLDSDDLWFPWTLQVFSDLIGVHNCPAVLSGCIQSFRDRQELPAKEDARRSVYFADYLAGGAEGHIVGSGAAVVQRDAFLRAGGFTARRINAEDHDLILRMGVEQGFVQVLSPPTLGWRQHADSATKNLRKSLEGLDYLIKQERSGVYPGGSVRARERQTVVTRHIRPAAMECLRRGMRSEAWSLYRSTFAWHFAIRRSKFLCGFPVKAFIELVRREARAFAEALLFRRSRGMTSRIRIMFYRMLGLKAGKQNRMERVRCRRLDQITIGSRNAFTEGCWLWPQDSKSAHLRIVIGDGNFFNRDVMIDACGKVIIGDGNMIGPGVYITDTNHTVEWGRSSASLPLDIESVQIANNCWVGARATILKGVTLGDNCIVAAGAVVTRSFPAGSVVAGVPAKLIRSISPAATAKTSRSGSNTFILADPES